MLFTPQEHGLWDTWIFPQGDKFYLFWLQDKNRAGPLYWDSFGLAESDDLIHWTEIGTILEGAEDAEDWIGTGRTWQVGDRFLLNFLEYRNGAGAIHFAESHDLRTWQRLGDEYTLHPDPRWYVAAVAQTPEKWLRYDLLVPVPLPDGGWLGFNTAQSCNAPVGARGIVGAAKSDDGIHWTGLPPASEHTIANPEVSGYVNFADRHYLFIGTLEVIGGHYDRFSPGAQANGMWYWCSDKVEGPYAPPEHDSLLHGSRTTEWSSYFGTAFRVGDKWLWNHHWIDTHNIMWLATLKELVEEAPWHLALRYWEGNSRLAGAIVLDGELPSIHYPQSTPGRPLSVSWQQGKTSISGSAPRACSGLAVIDLPDVAERGCMLTLDLQIESCEERGAGLFIGGSADHPADGIALLLDPAGRATVGHATTGIYSTWLRHWESFSIPPFAAGKVQIRAIVRADFVELYADERLLRTLRMPSGETFNGSVGLWIDGCTATLSKLCVWALNL